MQHINKQPKKINRRQLLIKGLLAFSGYLTGFGGISPAAAAQSPDGAVNRPSRIALIVDDIGYSRSIARQFAQLNLPLTFAILPRLYYSRELAVELDFRGYEIMLHQPMEPYNSCCDPGPGALFVGDGAARIERILAENIASMPLAAGINNHMGSRFTEAPEEVGQTMRVIKSRRLFFIDSVTSSNSIAYATAKKYHLSAAHRHVFLDNDRNLSSILYRLHQLKVHALKHGYAIGIGHPYRETALAIERFAARLNRSSISLVGISQIIAAGTEV